MRDINVLIGYRFIQLSTISLLSISINLLALYHEYRSFIGYATHYLFCCMGVLGVREG